jgi:zinc D-Ala-D-Ala carboxypeptidase
MPDLSFPPTFPLDELTRSATAIRLGLANVPGPVELANLSRLATTVLAPVEQLAGEPLIVDSGYRSPAVNQAVGGEPDSEHVLGLAADLRPLTTAKGIAGALRILFQLVAGPRGAEIPFDQLILESGCVHVSAAPAGQDPRRECLIRQGDAGAWTYERYDP